MAGSELATRENRVPERPQAPNDGTLLMEDARILFRNFEGKEGQYNREGDRNFCVLLPEDVAEQMRNDGWNVKQLKSRDGGETPGDFYIQVSVGFKGRPPVMYMITSKGRRALGEENCVLFDWADILICDLIIRPYHWNVNGKTGVKAYLKSIFITINEDYLELKYNAVPEIGEGDFQELQPMQVMDDGSLALEGDYDEDDVVDGELVE